MKVKNLLLLFLLTYLVPNHNQSVFASDLCVDSAKAICEESKNAIEASKKRIYALRKEIRTKAFELLKQSPPAHSQISEEYPKLLQAVTKVVFNKLADRGITQKAFFQKIFEVQTKVAQNMQDGITGTTLEDNSNSCQTNECLSQKIKGIKFLLSPDENIGPEFFYRRCGADGLLDQASYFDESNSFMICPGMLLEMLDTGNVDQLDQGIAHEISHSTDGYVLGKTYFKYQKFLTCIEENYKAQFPSVDKVIEQLGDPAQRRLRVFYNHLKDLPGDHAAELIDVEFAMEQASKQREYLINYKKDLTQVLGRAPNLVDSYAGELTADLGSFNTWLEILKNQPSKSRKSLVKNWLNVYCDSNLSQAKVAKYGSLLSDAEHPSELMRTGYFLNNPQLRLAMGCKDLTTIQPWCSGNDSSPLAMRCSHNSLQPGVERCENSIKRTLLLAGCSTQNFQCDPDDGQKIDCMCSSSNCRLLTRGGKCRLGEFKFPGTSEMGELCKSESSHFKENEPAKVDQLQNQTKESGLVH